MSRSSSLPKKVALGVNIDHVATLRQARGGEVPSVIRAAREAVQGGADSITVHLREDRRHIQDADLPALKKMLKVPLNLEMALVPEILAFALALKPEKVCLVPEKRQELTTEGGLDAAASRELLRRVLPRLHAQEIEVSLFLDPDPRQIRTAAELGADAVEIHTGAYSRAFGAARKRELSKIRRAAKLAAQRGLKVHAGHGLNYDNVRPVVGIREIRELNIGHAIVSEALFSGMRKSVARMKKLLAR